MADMNLHEYIVNGGRNFFSERRNAAALQLGYLPNFVEPLLALSRVF